MAKYSIGVVTYVRRFEEYFIPLVKDLERVFPDVEKNYVLNGFYDQAAQREYLQRAKNFLGEGSASTVTAYDEHQGLAKCWNQLVISSHSEKILILNDDVRVSRIFRIMLDLQADKYETATVNGSWSHFLIGKDTIRQVGWFDERFVGVGHEDGDYALRLALSAGLKRMPKNYLHTIRCLGIKNLIAKNNDPGWKNISLTTHGNKYAAINWEVFQSKWNMSRSPQKKSVYAYNELYFGIKPGMETPIFYPLSVLDSH